MNDNDWAILKRYGVTPDNLTVHGSLYLSGTAITQTQAARQYVSTKGDDQ